VFVYTVSGSTEQLEAFKTAQGTNYREAEDGTPLFFTVRCVGDSGTLIITSTGKVVPDMSQFDQAASLSKQYGGNFGQEIARVAAERLLGASKAPATAQVATATVPATEASKLDQE
jgi:hypothetical protein